MMFNIKVILKIKEIATSFVHLFEFPKLIAMDGFSPAFYWHGLMSHAKVAYICFIIYYIANREITSINSWFDSIDQRKFFYLVAFIKYLAEQLPAVSA